MKLSDRWNPRQRETRLKLRAAGPIMFAVGGLLLFVAVADMALAMGEDADSSARLVWLWYIAIPLTIVGLALMKAASRRRLGEEGVATKDSVPAEADDRAAPEATSPPTTPSPPAAGASASSAGTSLSGGIPCPSCGSPNDAAARFCDQCGRKMSGDHLA
jgi:hypothetical protein